MQALIERIGRSVGGVVGTLFQAGRDAVDLCLKTIIPFMAFVTFVIGLILETGVGDAIANGIKGFASSLGGLMIVCIICAIPVLSPLLGPGAVIAQIVGVLIGTEIGRGNIDVSMALPALFAINPQVVVTSYRLVWLLVKQNRRQLRSVSYTHLRAKETRHHLVLRLLLDK